MPRVRASVMLGVKVSLAASVCGSKKHMSLQVVMYVYVSLFFNSFGVF